MKNASLSALMLMSAASILSIPNVQAEEHDHSMHADHSGHDHTRPDSHAPIGVSGDHLMRDGEFMLTYRYMSMDMEGNRTGTDRV
ncbi:MAG: hypothetical protein GQ572_04995, partial [Gammaproteobacteria bacterium]|nr:hypothetical protein [Gammaproteobacteria bacterium]